MATGIILAGGESRRANTNKMLLEIDHQPLILHTIKSLQPFVDKIIVVTGKYDRELRPLLKMWKSFIMPIMKKECFLLCRPE